MILDTAPVPAKKRLPPDKVQRPSHRHTVAHRQHQQHVVAQGAVRDVEEPPRQIGRAPFPRAGVLIEAPEMFPMPRLDLIAGQRHDLPAKGIGPLTLLADHLAFAR